VTENDRQVIFDSLAEREKLLLAAKNDYPDKISFLSKLAADTIAEGGKILVCGNGGSAAESAHFVAEMIVRLTEKTERRSLPAISLASDNSVLTACANDYGYKTVFSRQIEGLGKPRDLLLALSTSGNSENVIEAVKTAKDSRIETAALLGKDGGKLVKEVDFSIVVPSQSVLRIQEEHLFLLHQLVELVEDILSPEG